MLETTHGVNAGSLGGGKRRQQLVHDTTAANDDEVQNPGSASSSSIVDRGTTSKRQIAHGVSRLDASLAAEMEKAQQMQSERRQPPDADPSGLDSSLETIAGTPTSSAETGDEDVQSLTDKIHIHRSLPFLLRARMTINLHPW